MKVLLTLKEIREKFGINPDVEVDIIKARYRRKFPNGYKKRK